MHLVIDARCIHDHQGGIGSMTSSLLETLGRLAGDFHVTALASAHHQALVDFAGIETVTVNGAMIDPEFEQLHLPDLLESLRADVYMNPTFAIPAIKTTRGQIAIIHDLVFEEHPEWVDPGLRSYLATSARFAARHADRIVTVSDFSATRIRELYGVGQDRIRSIPNGVPESAFATPTAGQITSIRRHYDLGDSYLLYLGSLERKKGIPELLQAFAALQRSGYAGDLALAGAAVGNGIDISTLGRGLPRPKRLRVLGYVPETYKRSLISGADLLVYPSLYEGFGLPPLEALALGVPCLVHDGTSLPEVVGEEGMRVDVTQPTAFAAALQRAVDDPGIAARARERGPAWVRQRFSWERSAHSYIDACASLMSA